MLASLLLNLPVGRKFPRDGIIDGKYLMVRGTYIDTKDKPEPETVKKVVRAVRKIKLPRKERVMAEKLAVQATRVAQIPQRAKIDASSALDVIAYRALIDLLKKNINETEEEALLLLLMKL